MTSHTNLLDLAIQYHEALPARIRAYLNERGIPDELIDFHLLGWNGWRITIPIHNRHGEVTFFRLAKDPVDKRLAPKMLSSPGSTVELYGWEQVEREPLQLIICEGEFDRLVLEAHDFAAVTSTGGAATFRPEWAGALKKINEVYVCFDRDNAGRNGAKLVALMLPQARIVELPENVGVGGDVTDFFVRLKRSREDFVELLDRAKPVQLPEQKAALHHSPKAVRVNASQRKRVERIKHYNPIANVVAHYVKLRPSGANLVGLCPFHNDQIPSFTVYPASDTFYCFGCGAHGDVISFIQRVEHMSFLEALQSLDLHCLRNEQRPQQNADERQAA
jgi:DNA primase